MSVILTDERMERENKGTGDRGKFTGTHHWHNREIRLSATGWIADHRAQQLAAALELLNFRLSGAQSRKNIWSTMRERLPKLRGSLEMNLRWLLASNFCSKLSLFPD